jgi:hypothetical protein
MGNIYSSISNNIYQWSLYFSNINSINNSVIHANSKIKYNTIKKTKYIPFVIINDKLVSTKLDRGSGYKGEKNKINFDQYEHEPYIDRKIMSNSAEEMEYTSSKLLEKTHNKYLQCYLSENDFIVDDNEYLLYENSDENSDENIIDQNGFLNI